MATSSSYPGSIPNYPADQTDGTQDIVYANHVNQLRADLKAVASTVGTNPSPGSTVGTYLSNLIAGNYIQGAQVATTGNLSSTLAHTVVNWPSPVFNFPSSIASIAGNLYIPANGIWVVTANVHFFNQNQTGGGLIQVQSANGSTVTRLGGNGPLPFITDGSHDNPQCHNVPWEGYLASGSRVWLEIAQTSGLTTTFFAQLSVFERRLA